MYNDEVMAVINALSRLAFKKGNDCGAIKEVIQAINNLTGEESMGALLINDTNSVMVQDVLVIHCMGYEFDKKLMEPDAPCCCPFGYMVEISTRCFTKYTPAELAAAIIHDILQVAMSDVCRIRYQRAFRTYVDARGLSMWTRSSTEKCGTMYLGEYRLADVAFLAYMSICSRPFRVPVGIDEYVGTDQVLVNMGLATDYNNWLGKALPTGVRSVDQVIADELQQDLKDVTAVFDSAIDKSLVRHVAELQRTTKSLALLSVSDDLESDAARESDEPFMLHSNSIRFKPHNMPDKGCCEGPEVKLVSEATLFGNSNMRATREELELRNEIDLIIGNLKFTESETDREVILHKIMMLRLKINKRREKLKAALNKSPGDTTIGDRIRLMEEYDSELDDLRAATVEKEISPRRWSVYMQTSLPDRYNF